MYLPSTIANRAGGAGLVAPVMARPNFFLGQKLSYRLVIQNDLSCIWTIMWVGPVDTHSTFHSWNGISNFVCS